MIIDTTNEEVKIVTIYSQDGFNLVIVKRGKESVSVGLNVDQASNLLSEINEYCNYAKKSIAMCFEVDQAQDIVDMVTVIERKSS